MTTKHRTNRRAFTLVEMLVVAIVISLILAASLPGFLAIFSAGADSQAYNMLTAQLAMARGMAMRSSVYTAVHVQPADATAHPDLDWVPFSAILVQKDAADPDVAAGMQFALAVGFSPQRIPGSMAFGELTADFVQAGGGGGSLAQYGELSDAQLADFMTFTVVFAPTGAIVKQVVDFDPLSALFVGTNPLWDLTAAEPNVESSVTAVTMFKLPELRAASGSRADYLNRNGQFIPINVYTGQLFPRL